MLLFSKFPLDQKRKSRDIPCVSTVGIFYCFIWGWYFSNIYCMRNYTSFNQIIIKITVNCNNKNSLSVYEILWRLGRLGTSHALNACLPFMQIIASKPSLRLPREATLYLIFRFLWERRDLLLTTVTIFGAIGQFPNYSPIIMGKGWNTSSKITRRTRGSKMVVGESNGGFSIENEVVILVEGTANLLPYFEILRKDYLDPVIEWVQLFYNLFFSYLTKKTNPVVIFGGFDEIFFDLFVQISV